MYILLLIVALLIPATTHASYLNQGTILRYEQDQNGAARLIVRFTGNAGEPIVDRPYSISSSSSLALLRNWIATTVSELNLARASGTAPQVAPGQILTGVAPSAPVPTAKSVWRSKVQIYGMACSQNFSASVGAACVALKADIESTYQAGFLDAQ